MLTYYPVFRFQIIRRDIWFDGNSSFEISYGRTDNVARVQLNVIHKFFRRYMNVWVCISHRCFESFNKSVHAGRTFFRSGAPNEKTNR